MRYPFASHFVRAGDLEVHYMREGRGEPLILLHGWPQTSYEWHHQIRSLSERFTVYAPDNRGFGATGKPRIRVTRDLLARDVVQFMDALGLEDAFVAGHDWGGIIAFKVAVDFPDRVRRLCLIDTSTTVWPRFAAHAYWANLHPEPLEFLAKYSKEMIEWCMRGKRADYRDVIPPFPPDPLPGSESGWCDDAALDHYVQAMADPGSHFATVEYYASALPLHRVRDLEGGGVSFDYVGAHGAREIWNHPGGPTNHPDLGRPLCFGPEDWNKRYEKPALFVYTPLLVPEAFGPEGWNREYVLGRDLWEQSIVRPFARLETVGIPCGHFVPEEAPEVLAPILLDFFS
jgi:pimeloyl-ACP methyl ester carboxylesterase